MDLHFFYINGEYHSSFKMASRQRKDRLSSLPDDILIGILNRLPVKLSIATGCLSLRWNGLWTNSTSIHICSRDFESLTELVTGIDKIATQITSPFIYSFIVHVDGKLKHSDWQPSMDCWLREICVRNIRELKVTCPTYWWPSCKFKFPSYIFQTQSLVSIDLDFKLALPFDDGGDAINLPNLKNLSLIHSSIHSDWLEKLIKACPSLEDLSIEQFSVNKPHLKCSNQNVRRLVIELGSCNGITINTPKVEYLHIRGSSFTSICFQGETFELREVKLVVSGIFEENLKLNCYQPVKDMSSFALYNVIRLILNQAIFQNINNLLTLVELFPVLECLIIQKLHCFEVNEEKNLWVLPKSATALSPALKKIEIEICWQNYLQPTKSFSEFVEYLLRNAINLEQLCFSVGQDGLGIENVKRERELELCRLLHRCSNDSMGCDIILIGKSVKMSSKDGPKACGENGKIFLLN